MPLTLTPRSADCTPIDLRGVTPDALCAADLPRLRRHPLVCGNRTVPLGELFDVAGELSDACWRLAGDWSHVHGVGAGMTAGEIDAERSVGRRAGAGLRGGKLAIGGDAGDFLATELVGGLVCVAGNAGDRAGGSLPGSRRGMRGGALLIAGNAGAELGYRMRRGLIAVAGNAGEAAGAHMLAGTILVWGRCGASPGAHMRRGTLGLFGPPPVLPATFVTGSAAALPMLPLLDRELDQLGFPRRIPTPTTWQIAHGDGVHGGRGEVLFVA